MPHRAGEFPWSTLVENVTGSFLLGLTVVVLVELAPSSRYLRPFFGVGVLGGYTTFSTYVLDVQDLLTAGQSALAATYLGGTVLLGLLGVWAGITTGHLGARLVRRGPGRAGGR
jgi:CrcB protein